MMRGRRPSGFRMVLYTSSMFARSSSCLAFRSTIYQSRLQSRMVLSARGFSDGSSSSIRGKIVVSLDEALAVTGSNDVKYVDGSWFMPNDPNRNARKEFETGPRILNARFFDIDDIATTPSPYLHMMPPKQLFGAAMDALSLTRDDHLIVYGSPDCPYVHRAWFQMRHMGHPGDRISVLQGSVVDWASAGGPVEDSGTPPKYPPILAKDLDLSSPTKYAAKDASNVVDKDYCLSVIASQDKNVVLVDARAPERFAGQVEEPRPGMRLGHMPGAKNVFFRDLLDDSNVSVLKPKDELLQILKDGGVSVDTDQKIVVHCGSGATACTVAMALEVCGKDPKDILVYDASWSEWGALEDTPIVKDH